MEETANIPQVFEDPGQKIFRRIKGYLLVIILILIFSLIVTVGLTFPNAPSSPKSQNIKPPAGKISKIAAKVGSENIYKQNLDSYKSVYPQSDNEALEQLINDSLILQKAASQKLVSLDSTFYNFQIIDIKKRTSVVDKVKEEIEKKADTISGEVVSVWFLNDRVGPLGYEASKKKALAKIQTVYNQVKTKKLTLRQAAALISSDKSLAQIDSSYKSNAYFTFTVNYDKSPTHSAQMNEALKKLPVGGLTEIFTIKSNDLADKNQMVDAYYSFGSVTSKTGNGQIVSNRDWFENAKKEFKVEKF